MRFAPVEPNRTEVANVEGAVESEVTEPSLEAQFRGPTPLKVGAGIITIGRLPICDVVVPEPEVSGRHARIYRNAGRLILEDCGSANGTLVNGEKVGWRVLREGDIVSVGSAEFTAVYAARAPRSIDGARLDAFDLGVELPGGKRILDRVSFTVLPGELVGIMGPSGSGKSTLLMALAGIAAPSAGQVRVDGRLLYNDAGIPHAELAAELGYAPQDDIMHVGLTVEEVVTFAAKLHAPAQWGAAELQRRVEATLRDVGLLEHRGTRIGSPDTSKTLSGGQRRRVNIAMELVTDPPVLLLDEPTSGLSARDAAEVMELLRTLSDMGRTVVVTIHQPSFAMFAQLDLIAVVELGQLAYFGPSVDAFAFFGIGERQPSALLDAVPSSGTAVWAPRFRQTEGYTAMVEGRRRVPRDAGARPRRTLRTLVRLWTLFDRGARLKLRDGAFLAVSTLVPAAVAGLFCSVLQVELGASGQLDTDLTRASVEHSYLVVLTIMTAFFAALSTSMEVFRERAVLSRERRRGLQLFPYLAAKAGLLLIPALLHPLCSLGVLWLFGRALEGAFLDYWVVLVPAYFASACAGLLLSAVSRSAEGVLGMAVCYAIVQTLFSAFAPLHVENTALRVVAATTTARWTLSGLVTRSDLCSGKEIDTALTQAPTPTAQHLSQRGRTMAFVERCEESFYQNHGPARDAAKPGPERTRQLVLSLGANTLFCGVALLLTGVLLARRRG